MTKLHTFTEHENRMESPLVASGVPESEHGAASVEVGEETDMLTRVRRRHRQAAAREEKPNDGPAQR